MSWLPVRVTPIVETFVSDVRHLRQRCREKFMQFCLKCLKCKITVFFYKNTFFLQFRTWVKQLGTWESTILGTFEFQEEQDCSFRRKWTVIPCKMIWWPNDLTMYHHCPLSTNSGTPALSKQHFITAIFWFRGRVCAFNRFFWYSTALCTVALILHERMETGVKLAHSCR